MITEENREQLANRNKSNLEEVVAGEVGDATGKLNPTWVEWLMGYPEGWTDLKD
jgi:DNA (cytosine-5)-methyltransferase 1